MSATNFLADMFNRAKDIIGMEDPLIDCFGDSDVFPLNGSLVINFELNMSFDVFDISDLYSGSRKTKRELQLITQKHELFDKNAYEKMCRDLTAVFQNWEEAGLYKIWIKRFDGTKLTTSPFEFKPEKQLLINKKKEVSAKIFCYFQVGEKE
jgi:hypothetical protein